MTVVFSADALATLLDEANQHPWESVRSALAGAEGQPHPRIAALASHLTATKRAYWTLISGVASAGSNTVPPPPGDAGLTRLMAWEVAAARALPESALSLLVTHSGTPLTVSELLRLNARHTAWHAGQIAALARRERSA
ncbi:DinB family protein [Deinococcus sp. QL22]|uniref:DinB family protein n=1 Tax=Deinococcus sp. QL22 TaxID=2939437 RepID=UPI002016C5D2|nr:DinB family protein [Deinococcus sp. QL22]UQN04921.1 hypothetical protein M1R55_08290 [Deinococcus sp. QL22]